MVRIDMTDFDVTRRAREHVAAARAFSAIHDARIAKITENRIEKFFWDVIALGNFDGLRRLARLKCSEMGEGLETVFALSSKHVRRIPRVAAQR